MANAVRIALISALVLNVIGIGLLVVPIRGVPLAARDTLLAVAWLSGAAACIHYERLRVSLGARASALRWVALFLVVAAMALMIWMVVR